MRFGVLPEGPRVAWAVKAAQKLLNEPITDREKFFVHTLSTGKQLLPDFPIRAVKIDGKPFDETNVDPENGVLYPEVPYKEYHITYRVGYLPGQIPAIVKELVTRLVEKPKRASIRGTDLEELVKVRRQYRELRDKAR